LTPPTDADAMQSPHVPETPGQSPVLPEEKPAKPRPEMPGTDPLKDRPQERPSHPDDPEDDSTPPGEIPEALAIRIP
jgi:hypothetical protein